MKPRICRTSLKFSWRRWACFSPSLNLGDAYRIGYGWTPTEAYRNWMTT